MRAEGNKQIEVNHKGRKHREKGLVLSIILKTPNPCKAILVSFNPQISHAIEAFQRSSDVRDV